VLVFPAMRDITLDFLFSSNNIASVVSAPFLPGAVRLEVSSLVTAKNGAGVFPLLDSQESKSFAQLFPICDV